jgi:hypothetical protein
MDPRAAALGSEETVVEVSEGRATVENIKTHVLREAAIWIRKVHLVNPVDVMEGSLLLPEDGSLPTPSSGRDELYNKLNDPMNEAYTDAVCSSLMSRLVETGRTPHFCRFFGTFNARSLTYSYNITEDLQDIENERWFLDGIKSGKFKVFAVNLNDPAIMDEIRTPTPFDLPRAKPLDVSSELSASIDALEIEELCDQDEKEAAEDEQDDLIEMEENDMIVEEVFVDRRNNVKINRNQSDSNGSQGSQGSQDDNSINSEDIEYRAVLRDFPVQVTCIERCDGTMDALMDLEMTQNSENKEERWTAWIFQVIAGLYCAQKHYDFVHNDLHTNNVVWSATEEPYLFYHLADRHYKVPTFGKIMKIIDFGRATFRPSGSSTPWISDAYAPDADAGGQYNCEPYLVKGQPAYGPNPSFDLCRLAIALIDSVWDRPITQSEIREEMDIGGPFHSPASRLVPFHSPVVQEPNRILTQEPGRIQHETSSPLWNLLWLWLTDKNGKNIVWDAKDRERYEDFDLYSAIARDSRNAVPSKQLTLPLFDSLFRMAEPPAAGTKIWELL